MPESITYFEYTMADIAELRRKDRQLGDAIDKIGPIRREIYPGACAGIIHAITGQQVSARAHVAIWQRFCAAFDPDDPHLIATAEVETLARTCGLSRCKAAYIKAIGVAFERGQLSDALLASLGDQDVRALLVQYAGIGRWTADMVLIFTLQRKNVLSYEDLAIRRGLGRLYGYSEVTQAIFQTHYQNYAPNATLAGLYLWEIAGAQNTN